MLSANTSNTPSVAQQLQGLSFDEIVAKFIEQQNILDAKNAILASSQTRLKIRISKSLN